MFQAHPPATRHPLCPARRRDGSRRLLSGAVAALCATGLAAAEPARFEVRDADSTITLFGTVHILPRDLQWRDALFNQAFAKAGQLWFEILPGSDKDPSLQQVVLAAGVDIAHPLNSRLSADEYSEFERAATSVGLNATQINVFRPWLASLQLTVLAAKKAGYDPTSGAELTLEAEIAGRTTKAFETAAQQISFLASLDADTEKAMLLDSVHEVLAGPDRLNQLVKLWQAGDIDALDGFGNEDMRRDFPRLYDVLVKRRNAAWVKAIEAEMAGAGTEFIAVGALHLAGADGVPALLRKDGYEVVQVAGASAGRENAAGAKSKPQPRKPKGR